MAKTKVQVLIATYNQEKFVARAIKSVLAQKARFNWQILVSDDASRDKTRRIVEALARENPDRLKLLDKSPHLGRGKNLEKLLKAADATYVALCAGDDYWLDDDKLRKQATFLDDNKNFSFCATRFQRYNENTQLAQTLPKWWQMWCPEVTTKNFLNRDRLASSTLFFRLDNFLTLDFDDFASFQEEHLIYKSLQYGPGKILNSVSCVYRIHDSNLYANKSEFERLLIDQHILRDLFEHGDADAGLATQFWQVTRQVVRKYRLSGENTLADEYRAQLNNK